MPSFPRSSGPFSIPILAVLLTTHGTPLVAQSTPTSDRRAAVPIDLPCPCPPAWLLGGNAGTLPLTHFLGTIDNLPLSIRVNNLRTMQYAYASNGTYHGMNVLGGAAINTITPASIGATIAGGGMDAFSSFDSPNAVGGDFGTVGGGAGNTCNAFGTIGGGGDNTASGPFAFIGGGGTNLALGQYSSIGGGFANESLQDYSTIGGGHENHVTATYSTIGGGLANEISAVMSTVAGGHANVVAGIEGSIGGGHVNQVGSDFGTIAGGRDNTVNGQSGAVGGGQTNTVSATGGTIPGGELNLVQGAYGFAAGQQAQALHTGSFVWADSTNAPLSSSSADEFSARAAGGVRFYSNTSASTGVFLAPGAGTWSTVSDRDAKEDIEPVDGRAVLARLAEVPISTWSYRDQADVRHMGPMAQDFYAAFALGLGERTLDTVDPDGVALAAIQGLNSIVAEQRERIMALERALNRSK